MDNIDDNNNIKIIKMIIKKYYTKEITKYPWIWWNLFFFHEQTQSSWNFGLIIF